MVVQLFVLPTNIKTAMAKKSTKAANAKRRVSKAQRRASKAQKRKANAKRTTAKAAVKIGLASLNNFFTPKTKSMGQTKSGNAKIEAKDIRVGISLFMNHPTAGHQVIDYSTDLERFRLTHQHVNRTPEHTIAYKMQMHAMLMDLFIKNSPIDEHFFTIGMHYLAAFDSVGNALHSGMFEDYGFMIEPVHDDFDAAMVCTLDYEGWNYGRSTRNAA